ncbi:MAG: hypothetical protein M1836_007940 [Candelina mexicana]|nr:MAG: hypothetical protein M1836_007940 [Candelina mexicana]
MTHNKYFQAVEKVMEENQQRMRELQLMRERAQKAEKKEERKQAKRLEVQIEREEVEKREKLEKEEAQKLENLKAAYFELNYIIPHENMIIASSHEPIPLKDFLNPVPFLACIKKTWTEIQQTPNAPRKKRLGLVKVKCPWFTPEWPLFGTMEQQWGFLIDCLAQYVAELGEEVQVEERKCVFEVYIDVIDDDEKKG